MFKPDDSGYKANAKFPLSDPPRGGELVWETAEGMRWRRGKGRDGEGLAG